MKSALLLSVIIPTYKRPDGLRLCLSKLVRAAELLPRGGVEVIVSDDDPEGSAREVVDQFPEFVTWTQGSCRGPAANRNAGAKQSKGNLLVFLDDDCIPDNNLLHAYSEAATQDLRTDVFEGRIAPGGKMRYADEFCPTNENGGYLWSANIAVRRECFEALAGFDEEFPFAATEDVDFRFRLLQNSKLITFCPQASVTHPVEVRRGRARLQKAHYSILLYAEKHPEEIEKLRNGYSPICLLRMLKQRVFMRSLVQPMRSYQELVQELWAGMCLFLALKNLSTVQSTRRRIGALLACRDI